MSRTIEKTVFTFDELDESAKERARDWWRNSTDESDFSATLEDVEQVAAILGIEFATRPVKLMGGGTRNESLIYYSVSYSQGDGASFEGFYRYAKGAPAAIRAYAPKDSRLHSIADDLAAVQKRYFYSLAARMGRGPGSNFYSHSGTMSVDVEDSRDSWRDIGKAADIVEQAMRDFADWIHAQLVAEYEFIMSDENVNESIRINGYEFDESGHIA